MGQGNIFTEGKGVCIPACNGGCLPLGPGGVHPPGQTPLVGKHPTSQTPPSVDTPLADTLPPPTPTEAGGTHPIGMHSCVHLVFSQMASANVPAMTDKPPPYTEATGVVNTPAGAVPGYGATGYGAQEPPAGAIKTQPGAYAGIDAVVFFVTGICFK